MRRRVVLTFFYPQFFYYGLIDIWPIFHSGPSVLRVFLTSFTFPLSPFMKPPLPLVRSIVVTPPMFRKSTCNAWLMFL